MRVTSVDDINREMMGYMERHGKTKAGELSELVGISIPSIRYRLFQLMAHGVVGQEADERSSGMVLCHKKRRHVLRETRRAAAVRKSRQAGTETVTSVTQGNKQRASSSDSVSNPAGTGALEQRELQLKIDQERRRLRLGRARVQDLQLGPLVFYSSLRSAGLDGRVPVPLRDE